MDGSISTCAVLHEQSTLAVAIVISELPRRTVVTNEVSCQWIEPFVSFLHMPRRKHQEHGSLKGSIVSAWSKYR